MGNQFQKCDIQKNIDKFESLMKKVRRKGKDKLLDYIRNETNFFHAPGAMIGPYAYEGGLLERSLGAYELLKYRIEQNTWGNYTNEFFDSDSIIVIGLLYNLAEANRFLLKDFPTESRYKQVLQIADNKCYVKKEFVNTSVEEETITALISRMQLKDYEYSAIRFRNNFKGYLNDETNRNMDLLKNQITILALHEADLESELIFIKRDLI